MKWNEIVPVIVSVAVILIVATMQRYSKTAAAITATMPLTIPLSLWIVYSSSKGDRLAIEAYTGGMVGGIIPTLAFVIAIWFASRFGFKLLPTIAFGYSIWGLTLLAVMGIRRILGVT